MGGFVLASVFLPGLLGRGSVAHVDYVAAFNALSEPPSDEAVDRWRRLIELGGEIRKRQEYGHITDGAVDWRWPERVDWSALDPEVSSEYSAESVEAARSVFDSLVEDGVFVELERVATAGPPSPPPEVGPLWSSSMSDAFRSARGIVHVERVRFKQTIDREDSDAAIGAIRTILAATRSTSRPYLLDWLVAVAMCATLIDTIDFWLIHDSIDAEIAVDLLGVLPIRAPIGPIARTLEGERLVTLEFLQQSYQGAAAAPGTPALSPFYRWKYSHREVVRAVDSYFDEAERIAEVSAHSLSDEQQALESIDSAWGSDPMFSPLFAPLLSRPIEIEPALKCSWRAARLRLALDAYRSSNDGAYPDDLESLVPAVIEAIPLDPLAPDGAFRYIPAADGSSYVLYSVGFDGEDNGGLEQLDRGHSAPRLKAEELGRDFVFGLPDESDE